MKKSGYIILFVSLGIFLSCVTVFSLLLSSYLCAENEKAKAEEFLLTDAEHLYVNSALLELLDSGTKLKNSKDTTTASKFVSPEGIEFISRSKQWDSKNLELLYQELLRNKHGEELYYLSSVVVYPQADENAAATHKNSSRVYSVPVAHTILPEDFEINYSHRSGQISLYDGDRITTPEGMADSLSHEYGHHYTRYHMLKSYDHTLYDTEYAKLRGLNDENSYTFDDGDDSFYYDNHHKYLLEIAAEDYVTLMGSPTTRAVTDYKDIMEILYMDSYVRTNTRCCAVQENLTLPMACEVEGLADYFYSFLGEDAPDYDIKKDMNIRINRRSKSFNLNSGYTTFVYYEIEFDKVYGEDAAYVLSVYDPEDYHTLRPIRTITKDEKALCYIGNAVRDAGSRVIYNDDEIANGTKVFIINVITAEGELYTSDPFTHTF